jgi:hypothetical protein
MSDTALAAGLVKPNRSAVTNLLINVINASNSVTNALYYMELLETSLRRFPQVIRQGGQGRMDDHDGLRFEKQTNMDSKEGRHEHHA